jgi:hypothetical protein
VVNVYNATQNGFPLLIINICFNLTENGQIYVTLSLKTIENII